MILILSCSWLCPIHLSQVLSPEWRCGWSCVDRWCSNCIWVILSFVSQGASYIRGLALIVEVMWSHLRCYQTFWIIISSVQTYICLTSRIHNLIPCWLIISQVLWHSPEQRLKISILDMGLKITDLSLKLHLLGVNELTWLVLFCIQTTYCIFFSVKLTPTS